MKKGNGLIALLILISFVCAAAAGFHTSQKGEANHVFSREAVKKEILFDGDHIFTNDDSSVRVDGTRVTIKREGTYMLRGNLEDGQVIVDVGGEDRVVLKLNDVTLRSLSGPVLYVKRAGKVTLKLKADSENEFRDGPAGPGDSPPDRSGDRPPIRTSHRGCIYARSDLKIKGGGRLAVYGAQKHGIFCSKDLKIRESSLTVEAPRQALHGKKSITIESGSLNLLAGTDGIHSNGSLEISGGSVEIDAGKYGLYAYSSLLVDKAAQVKVVRALSQAGCQGPMTLDGLK